MSPTRVRPSPRTDRAARSAYQPSPQSRRAVITGAGLLTPLGRSVDETWAALLAGKFITDHSRAAGEYDRTSPRVIQMARRVAGEALAQSGWMADDDFATIVGTSKGSVESWLPDATPWVWERCRPRRFPPCSRRPVWNTSS